MTRKFAHDVNTRLLFFSAHTHTHTHMFAFAVRQPSPSSSSSTPPIPQRINAHLSFSLSLSSSDSFPTKRNDTHTHTLSLSSTRDSILFFITNNRSTMRLSKALSLLLLAESASAFSTGINTPFVGRSTHVQQQQAPSSHRTAGTSLYGILEEVAGDAYDLTSGGTDQDGFATGTEINMNDAYEMFLAELVFSTNDPRVDIANNMEKCVDEKWIEWLDNKIETSNDPEERVALRDLYDMIFDVKKRLDISKLAEERQAEEEAAAEAARLAAAEAQAEAGKNMSDADVLRKATAIDTAVSLDADAVEDKKKKSFLDAELTPEIRLSYQDMLEKVLPPYEPGATVESVVFNNYEQFDAQFVKVLTERASQGDNDAQAVLTALAVEQQKKITVATETLKEVLALGDPMRMEGALVKLAREGRIDEPFLLLLEANANQAREAGALGPAQLMEKLGKRAAEEKDKNASSKEIRLLRQLLRTASAAEREKLFEDAFTPKDSLIVSVCLLRIVILMVLMMICVVQSSLLPRGLSFHSS